MNIRKSRAALAGVAACVAVGGVTFGTQAAQAQAPLPLTPALDCVTNSGNGIVTPRPAPQPGHRRDQRQAEAGGNGQVHHYRDRLRHPGAGKPQRAVRYHDREVTKV
jgi:hypothetical protein